MTAEADQRRQRLRAARLYFVSESPGSGKLAAGLLEEALSGGTDLIQLREKRPRSGEELVSLAAPFRLAAADHGALFLLNDRPDLVEACGADGVHVGQDDVPVREARRRAGAAAVIGLSTHSPQELDAACTARGADRPDYLSVGPIWATPTKEGRAPTGLDYVRYASDHADLPWFAIGGIDAGNVRKVVAAGATRIVVVRAIRDAADPLQAARRLRAALDSVPAST